MSTGGALLCTISAINLAVISTVSVATGKPTQYWILTVDVQSDGWTARDYFAQFNLMFTDSSGVVLAPFQGFGQNQYTFVVGCHENSTQVTTGNFDDDVFSLIAGAHLSMPNATFFGC